MFYILNITQANQVGIIKYDLNKFLNPFVAQQNDDTYVVNEIMINLLGEKVNKKLDFKIIGKLNKNQLDLKQFPFLLTSSK